MKTRQKPLLGADLSPAWHAPAFLESLRSRLYSPHTLTHYGQELEFFIAWAEQMGVTRPEAVTYRLLDGYRRYLFRYRRRFANGRQQALSHSTQSSYLSALRTYFRWLVRNEYLLVDPAQHLPLPRQVSRLPDILTREEVQRILSVPDVAGAYGLRDRAFLELLYATGMRRSEILRLEADQIDFSRGLVLIRQGKGRKDRVVPVGARALLWVQRYLEESRPYLSRYKDEGTLFLTRTGTVFDGSLAALVVKKYFAAAGLSKKRGSCHLFRHACATHMLEGGADIRYVQEMLGHASLKTTQIYTRVSIGRLQEVYARSHPSGTLEPDGGS